MLVDEFGRTRVARVIAETLSTARRGSATTDFKLPSEDELLANTRSVLSAANPSLKTVIGSSKATTRQDVRHPPLLLALQFGLELPDFAHGD